VGQDLATAPQSAVPFRRVLLLSIPALLVALVLRASFLHAIPEIYYGSDSNSYFETAWRFWTDGDIILKPKRRFLYPIVLIFMPILPGSTAVAVAFIQHLLGLAVIVGIGWVVAQMTRFPSLWVPLATCLVAVWPRMLWYEHEMIAEVWLLAAFVAAVAIAVPCGSLKNPRRLFWFLFAAAAIVATKPAGRPLWLGLMLVSMATAGNPPWQWEKKSLAIVALAVVIIFTSGSGRQGSSLWLSSTLPFVQTEGEPYAEYRAVLRPFVERARADVGNYAELQSWYSEKVLNRSSTIVGQKWFELTRNTTLYQEVYKRLAFEAILSHPFAYAQLVFRKIAFAAAGMDLPRIAPARFWADQESRNFGRPKTQLELVYGMDTDAQLRLVEERRQRSTWLAPAMKKLSTFLNWTTYRRGAPGENPEINLTVLGWLLALGLIACLSPRHFFCRALLWLPVAFYLFAIFGVGEAVRRYLHPVDWVGIVLIAIGLDSVMGLFTAGVTAKQPHIESDVSPRTPSVRTFFPTSNSLETGNLRHPDENLRAHASQVLENRLANYENQLNYFYSESVKRTGLGILADHLTFPHFGCSKRRSPAL
jgi:hypothetical protein